jgi:hypothetical protein
MQRASSEITQYCDAARFTRARVFFAFVKERASLVPSHGLIEGVSSSRDGARLDSFVAIA